MTTLVTVKALLAFSIFHEGFGIVHGDPDSSDEAARFPDVPEERLPELLEAEKVEEMDPLDHDGDGRKGGSLPAAAGAVDKRRAALARANAARAAKAAQRKAEQADTASAPPPVGGGTDDAPVD